MSAALERPARRVSRIALVAVLAGLAAPGARSLNVVAADAAEPAEVRLRATAAATSAERFADEYVAPIERELLGQPPVAHVDMVARDGVVRLRVVGRGGARAGELRALVDRALGAATMPVDTLDEEAGRPGDAALREIAVLGGDGAARGAFARDVLLPAVRAAGAGRVELLGAPVREIVAVAHAAALAARGLSIADLATALAAAGGSAEVGRVRDGGLVRALVVGAPATTLADLERASIGDRAEPVRLRDVATLAVRAREDGSLYRFRGAEATLLRVFDGPAGNALVDGWRLDRVVARLRRSGTGGLRLVDVTSAGAPAAITAGVEALAAAMLLSAALLVVLAGLRATGRAVLALGVALPATVLVALAAGLEVDGTTLGAIAAATGAVCALAVVARSPAPASAAAPWRAFAPALAAIAAAAGTVALGGGFAARWAVPLTLVAVALAAAAFSAWSVGDVATAHASAGASTIATRAVAGALATAFVAVVLWRLPVAWHRQAVAHASNAGYAIESDGTPEEAMRRGTLLATAWATARGAPREQRQGSADDPWSWYGARGELRGDLRVRANAAGRGGVAGAARLPPSAGGAELPEGEHALWVMADGPGATQALAGRVASFLRDARLDVRDAWSGEPRWEIVARPGHDHPALERALAAALAGTRLGSATLPGTRPGIRLLVPGVDEVARWPVPVRASSAADPVVAPLRSTAWLRRVTSHAPLLRHDGAPASLLLVRGDERAIERVLERFPRSVGQRIALAPAGSRPHVDVLAVLLGALLGAGVASALGAFARERVGRRDVAEPRDVKARADARSRIACAGVSIASPLIVACWPGVTSPGRAFAFALAAACGAAAVAAIVRRPARMFEAEPAMAQPALPVGPRVA